MRVLLTGASGFVGRHAQRHLLDLGFDVHGVGRSLQRHSALPGVVSHACDLLDATATIALVEAVRPTHLLHLAWYALPGDFWASAQNVLWVNASNTLVKAFVNAGGTRAVIAGTCAEYAWNEELCTEFVTPLRPTTTYGRCKCELYEQVARLAKRTSLSMAWARLFFMYGNHERPGRLVSSVIASLLRNRKVACTEGNQVRDFMLVDDAARALAALLLSTVEGPVNVASGEAHLVGDVIRLIGVVTARPDLIEWGARREKPGEPNRIEANTRRLNTEVNFYPAYTLGAGILRTVAWWREEIAGATARAGRAYE